MISHTTNIRKGCHYVAHIQLKTAKCDLTLQIPKILVLAYRLICRRNGTFADLVYLWRDNWLFISQWIASSIYWYRYEGFVSSTLNHFSNATLIPPSSYKYCQPSYNVVSAYRVVCKPRYKNLGFTIQSMLIHSVIYGNRLQRCMETVL